MDNCVSSNDVNSCTGGETSFGDESELNTADLSHISGLSRVLRADDSIADRVRCLLASDSEEGNHERPELLNSVKELPSSNELAERISKLLQEPDPANDKSGSGKDDSCSELRPSNQDSKLSISRDEVEGLNPKKSMENVPADATVKVSQITFRRSGDGADNEPTTIAAESSDDIMNVSDATEYSDLPKVVDNPIKRRSTDLKSTSQPYPRPTIDDTVPQPSKSQDCHGDRMTSITETEKLKDTPYQAEDEKLSFHVPTANIGIPSHSTPHEPSVLDNVDISGNDASVGSLVETKTPYLTESVSETQMKYEDHGSKAKTNFSDENSLSVLPKQASDDKLLARIRKAVSNTEFNSASLKGSHTSSEQSIASSIDSLGLKVKRLLKGKEYDCPPEADVSTVSNFSAEISNFEKTNLWKYTRQFLPGAMAESSAIQPLKKISDESPVAIRDVTSESSTSSTPVTSRLAREVITPVNDPPFYGSDIHSSSYNPLCSQENGFKTTPHFEKETSKSYARESYTQRDKISVEKASSHNASEDCPLPSSYSSRWASQVKDYTPGNNSYKALHPEYSDTPYTPYSFVTPRRVAWEAEVNRSPISSRHQRNAPMERSAYFNQDRISEMQSKPRERPSAVPYRRVNSDASYRTQRQNRSVDYMTSSNEYRASSSGKEVSVKPVTPALSKSTSPDRNDAQNSLRKLTSPKTVRFSKTVSPYKPGSRSDDVKSASLPEYSFTTPKASSRQKCNITPKVEKEKPRPTRSLPTYDQLIVEESADVKHAERDPDTDIPTTTERSSFSMKTNSTMEDIIRSSTPTMLDTRHQSNAGFIADTFSALKPEICLEDSVCENDILRLTAKETDVNDHVGRESNGSNKHPCTRISSASDISSFNDPATKGESDGMQQDQKQFPDSGPLHLDTEPAPLPFVRLGRKRPSSSIQKRHTPPRRSISTEKVQNLLLKEHCTGKSSAKPKLPPTSCDYSSSSDDDLLNLMETVASKVPLMQRLLKKLYDRNLERKKGQEPHDRVSERWNLEIPETTDRCVQTISSPTKSKVLRAVSKDLPSGKGKKSIGSVMESSCQTSLVQPKKRILVAHKATSPMEDLDTVSEDDMTLPEKSTKEFSHGGMNCNKENSLEPKRPCAFYVDMTSEKYAECEMASENSKPPAVAWYEPYEYVPLWKRDQTKRKTLGFVDVNIQDAFLNNKRNFVLRSWERQEDIAIRAEERRLRDLEQHIHDQIRALHKEKALKMAPSASLPPKPQKKKERTFGWKEMKQASKQKYEALPEVVAKKQEAERMKFYEANRKRAELYKRRITQMIVQKQRGKSSSGVRSSYDR